MTSRRAGRRSECTSTCVTTISDVSRWCGRDRQDDVDEVDDARGPEPPSGMSGIDLVRRTLEEARAAARAQGKDVGRGRTVPPVPRRVAGQRRRWSGPGPDSGIRSRWAG